MITRYKSLERDDCFRTSLACILGVNPYKIPHRMTKEKQGTFLDLDFLNNDLKPLGMVIRVMNAIEPFNESISEFVGLFGTKIPFIITGKTKDEEFHCFIYQGLDQIHDVSNTDTIPPKPLNLEDPFNPSIIVTYQFVWLEEC